MEGFWRSCGTAKAPTKKKCERYRTEIVDVECIKKKRHSHDCFRISNKMQDKIKIYGVCSIDEAETEMLPQEQQK